MRIDIRPAVRPEVRHSIQKALQDAIGELGKVDGGCTDMSGVESSIYIYPAAGRSEDELRMALVGTLMEPPWELPSIDPDALPTDIPEAP